MRTPRTVFSLLLLSLAFCPLAYVDSSPGDPVAVKRPAIPRHYPHIRIAMLAYHGNPMGSFETELLRNSVDLVIPNETVMKHIRQVAPDTAQLIYTNTSNLYLDLLTDWLDFA